MALDKSRGFYPIDGNGKITVQDIIDEVPGGGDSTPVTVDTLTGATATGKALMKAASQEAARTTIGAGTSNLAIGTTAQTAKAGNYTPPVVTTSANGLMLAADKVKLNGIAENATANSTDAQLRDRSTHTGTQAMSTITGLEAALDTKATEAALALLEARIEALENA